MCLGYVLPERKWREHTNMCLEMLSKVMSLRLMADTHAMRRLFVNSEIWFPRCCFQAGKLKYRTPIKMRFPFRSVERLLQLITQQEFTIPACFCCISIETPMPAYYPPMQLPSPKIPQCFALLTSARVSHSFLKVKLRALWSFPGGWLRAI